MKSRRWQALLLVLVFALAAIPADAQRRGAAAPRGAALRAQANPPRGPVPVPDDDGLLQLDFTDVELSVVIDTIAQLTNKNFIYDDRVRGRVTIVSPRKVTMDQAYAVFESVLQVKGFTTVKGPGGILKIIPTRDAKESSIETIKDSRPSPNRDQFVTRLIPLKYIDAEAITNTVKPLVSKDASMVTYQPTNTIILTDTEANIRRLLSILDAIDVETYQEELAVIKIENADAATLGQQISDIYGAEVSGASAPAARRSRATNRRSGAARATTDVTAESVQRGKVRIITDDRTNSLLVLASRNQLDDIRGLVRQLDVPVRGGGSIRVYRLLHADAEELAQTLNGLVSGAGGARGAGRTGAAGGGSATAQALRAQVTELEGGVTLTADPATNSLVIQASKEAYETLSGVIQELDIERPQVLVEALIMEVDVTDSSAFGINSLLQITGSIDTVIAAANNSDTIDALGSGDPSGIAGLSAFAASLKKEWNGNTIQAIIVATASDDTTNIISAPHILTSDNEEAEIRIGDNIPIITSRVDAARGASVGPNDALSSSVNVERQDIGVTLRVTPQISEGDTLRLRIFQEITNTNTTLQSDVGNVNEVGPALSNRRIENTVVVADGETVVIGGLLGDKYEDIESKTPFLGDIPILGWLFKRQAKSLVKTNLLVFLTPNIVRSSDDLLKETIRKRNEFRAQAGRGFELSKDELEEAERLGIDPIEFRGANPVRQSILDHAERYPLQLMATIEQQASEERDRSLGTVDPGAVTRYGVRTDLFQDSKAASEVLTHILDAGYDGNLVSGEQNGLVLFEIQVGPYDSLDEAQQAAATLKRSFELKTSVLVLEPETP